MTDDNACKKAKMEEPVTSQWKITFDQTQGLRTLVEVVGNILKSINFRIEYDENRGKTHFLCIDSVDPKQVCMIQARMSCEKAQIAQGADNAFCVDSSIFNLILKNVQPHYSLEMEKFTNSADIVVRAYEALSSSHSTRYELPTLVDESMSMNLDEMLYKYTVEIDLVTLRQIVKMSRELQADNLNFSVRQPVAQESGTLHSTLTIACKGETGASQAHSFLSTTVVQEASDACVITAVTDAAVQDCVDSFKEDCAEVYRGSFATDYLGLFLKSMERSIITMKLSEDKPLLLRYPLGADTSYICFVLARKNGDD